MSRLGASQIIYAGNTAVRLGSIAAGQKLNFLSTYERPLWVGSRRSDNHDFANLTVCYRPIADIHRFAKLGQKETHQSGFPIERAAQLYEQERRNPEGLPLLGPYVRRWVAWLCGGLGEIQKISHSAKLVYLHV
jgi:hypothetical protein